MALYCGLDFGTSNSVITVLRDDGGKASFSSVRQPSLMFFPEDRESTVVRYCGQQALDEYIRAGLRGRFFQSIKTVLHDPGFLATTINGKRFSAEDLVAVMLRYLRTTMEAQVGEPITHAVVGRPARFSDLDSDDALAEERLQRAAEQAGLESIVLEYEPVAGARAYGDRPGSSGVVFVADHGGGTSDFTVMDLGGGPGAERILATHGVRVGGDDFDAEIVWNRLTGHFGYGTTYESWGKRLPVPVHIYRIICRWDQIHFLKTLKYRDELRYFRRGAEEPAAIERLIELIENDLGYFLYQAVEAAKFELSDGPAGGIRFQHGSINLDETVGVASFEAYIRTHIRRTEEAVAETLSRAQLTPDRIDTVFLTGGSSRVPAVKDVFRRLFGAQRVMSDVDEFMSVSRGLALSARERQLSTAGAVPA
jgi:hypothetical chaperone protein